MMNELLTPAETARADKAAIAGGIPVAALMENAGRAVARAIVARIRPCRTLVLCGPGNNGGDGYVAGRLLAQRGWPVSTAALSPARGDAGLAAVRWHGPTVPFTPGEVARADLVIDAIFGAGLTRDLDPEVIAVLEAARRIVAIDVPSGLDGATGQPRGYAPRADLTVTFFRCKPGHLLLPGRTLCGELVLADIGLPATVLTDIACQTFRNTPALWTLPRPAASGHKYSRGHVTILGGATMTGAARLAAAAARRAGAGLVTIAPVGSAETYRAGDPGVMIDAAGLAAQLADPRRTVWLAGPGLGIEAAAERLPIILAAHRRTVLDADALSACSGSPDHLRGATVVTPHEGEFTRVFGPLGPDRTAAVRAAARRIHAVVLLKGAATIIAAPDGRAAINDNAPPWLATAGAGDILAGLIAGLLAQGLPAFEAAAAAAWLHGHAATALGPGLIAEDLPCAIADAITAAHV